MALIDTFILVPIEYNDGRKVEESKYDQLELMILEQIGGYTKETGLRGGWRDPQSGKVYRDEHVKYVIGIDSWAKVSDIIGIAKWIKKEWEQESVYISIAGIPDFV